MGAAPAGSAATAVPAPAARFPTIENDERLVKVLAPAFLGVSLGDVGDREQVARDLPGGSMTVVGVESGSPAAAAGILPGDVLLGEADAPARERGSLKLALASGHELVRELDVMRGKRRLRIGATFTRAGVETPARDLPAAGRIALGSLTPLRGQVREAVAPRKPYLLFFWATWCTYCKFAVPELLHLERERGIRIVSITDESKLTIESFLQRWPTPFPTLVALDLERKVNEAFEIEGYPTFILVDELGRVSQRWMGYRPDSGLPIPGWSATGKK